MAQTFLDFHAEIDTLRNKISEQVVNMLRNQNDINCKNRHVDITLNDGEYSVATIYHTTFDDTVQVKTITGTVIDFADLSTDDMIALYEFVFNHYNPLG